MSSATAATSPPPIARKAAVVLPCGCGWRRWASRVWSAAPTLSVAHKTGLALLCDLAALLVLCVLAHLARPVALGFMSDAQQDASDTRRRGWRCEKVFRGYVRVSHLAKTISAHLFASLTSVQRVRIPLWLAGFFSCAFSLLSAAYKTLLA